MKPSKLSAFVFFIGLCSILSCQKETNLNKFSEPFDKEEIENRINEFLTKKNFRSNNNILIPLEESIWNIEASLNYLYDELDIPITSEIVITDSFQISNNNGFLVEEDVFNCFHQFESTVLGNLNSNNNSVIRLIDVNATSNDYLTATIILGIKDTIQTRAISDPYFSANESYYMYLDYDIPNVLPIPNPGPYNAARMINIKLNWRFNIAIMPQGSYWVNVTIWSPTTSILSPYYNQICQLSPGNPKLWGSPDINALYKGTSEGTYLTASTLNYQLDEAYNWINFYPPPNGKQVSTIEYNVVHAGEYLDPSATPCISGWEFSAYFRFKFAHLVNR